MYKYATKIDKEKNVKAVGLALPVSTKHCVEIFNHIRGKNVEKTITLLEKVIELKQPIPFKRFKRDLAHRKGMGPGRYPVSACKEIIKVLKSASANAQYKGMSVSNLYIKHICAHLASRPWHYGRQTRRKMKRTHIEVVLEEKEVKKKPEIKIEEKTVDKQKSAEKPKQEKSKTADKPKEKVEESKEKTKPETKKVQAKGSEKK